MCVCVSKGGFKEEKEDFVKIKIERYRDGERRSKREKEKKNET